MHLTSFDMGPGTTSFKGGSEELALGGESLGSVKRGLDGRSDWNRSLVRGVVAELLLFLANK